MKDLFDLICAAPPSRRLQFAIVLPFALLVLWGLAKAQEKEEGKPDAGSRQKWLDATCVCKRKTCTYDEDFGCGLPAQGERT